MKWFGRSKKKPAAGKPDKAMQEYLDAREKMAEGQAERQKAAAEKARAMEAEQERKAAEVKQAGKKVEGKDVKKRTLASLFGAEELQRVKAMAREAMGWQPFVDACKKHRIEKPAGAFLSWYAKVKDNPQYWDMEARAEESMEVKGGRFNRTGFYAQLFIDYLNHRAAAKKRASEK